MAHTKQTNEEMNAEVAADIKKYCAGIKELVEKGTFPQSADGSNLAAIVYSLAICYSISPEDLMVLSQAAASQLVWSEIQGEAMAAVKETTHGSC